MFVQSYVSNYFYLSCVLHFLFKDYQRHLTSQPTENDDFGLTPDVEKENLPLENVRGVDVGESIRQVFPGTLCLNPSIKGINVWPVFFYRKSYTFSENP